ncbi:hypothetical protein Q1695_000291 [Nippostrongylus brasiliensis]|nr:hypothetical protein Q1695_000291 [Nippostrongylus brasiliensis]
MPVYSVVPDRVYDILKQPKDIRDLVQRHGSANVIPARPEVCEIDCGDFLSVDWTCEKVEKPSLACQFFYDEIFPGMGYYNDKYDDIIYEQEEVYFPMANMCIDDMLGASRRKYDTLTPVMHTACPRPQRQTQKNVIKAFFDRNGCVPELATVADEVALAKQLRDCFFYSYIADNEAAAYYFENPLTINFDSIDQWLKTQPPQVGTMIFSDEDWCILQKELDRYNYILKTLPKPKLEFGADLKNPSPQTIAHSCKLVNAIFCPLVREIKRRVISVLRETVLIYTDMDPEDLERILDARFPMTLYETLSHMLEIDVSKYDKSQGRVALLFEIEMLRAFGFPEEWLSTWAYMHITSTLYSPVAGFSAKVEFQRKSGDAMTFFGNTLFLMGVIAFAFDVKDAFCLFSGDDSLVFSRKNTNPSDGSLHYNASHHLRLLPKLQTQIQAAAQSSEPNLAYFLCGNHRNCELPATDYICRPPLIQHVHHRYSV